MAWPFFPKRLQSALKALCCLAENQGPMLSHEIAKQINVPNAETAKILQLLVWGGFITSRRGSKGGFQLSSSANRITMGEVIEFFLARHAVELEDDSPVMKVLLKSVAPCQKAFAKLSLAEIAQPAKPGTKKSLKAAPLGRPDRKTPRNATQ
jgi:Rrf2 family protein